MAFRLKFSVRALRETGEARTWYETQNPGPGEEFVAAIELQLKRLEQAPLLYAEVIPRFPYGLRHDLVFVLAVLHDARNLIQWHRTR